MHNDQPSRTAEYMALFRAVEAAEVPKRRLFQDEYAIHLLSGTLRVLARIAQMPVLGRLVPAFLDSRCAISEAAPSLALPSSASCSGAYRLCGSKRARCPRVSGWIRRRQPAHSTMRALRGAPTLPSNATWLTCEKREGSNLASILYEAPE